MSTYVLIHGAWFGAWCWKSTLELLHSAGHQAIAIDLPGHGDDTTPAKNITLDTLVDRVGKLLTAQPDPVILVGHSMGGMVISQAAEKYPDRTKRLVYVAAYLLQTGESLLQITNTDADSEIGSYLLPDRGIIGIKPQALTEIFLHDCSRDIIAEARQRLQPDFTAPQATPLNLTTENFGRVPRTYISTKLDRVVSPSLQKRMCAALPCDRVIEIATGHCPFLAPPGLLVAYLTKIN